MNLEKTGEQLKIEGMDQAADHANQVHENWTDIASRYLKAFCQANGSKNFQAEDAREWAERNGIPEPPSKRAWGNIFSIAQNTGLLFHQGYGKVSNPKAHNAIASIWSTEEKTVKII